MLVACITSPSRHRYRVVASAMAQGVKVCKDTPISATVYGGYFPANVGLGYGWKYNHVLKRYPKYVYFDLGYWDRERYYRWSMNGWSPTLKRGMPPDRFRSFGLDIKPWRTGCDEIIVAGSTLKAAQEHGLRYQEWETKAIQRLQGLGKRVVYRPKPNDKFATPIPGAAFDQRPISEALASAHGWVTHHSNSAVDALLAGVPVHCETGAASHFSVPMETMGDPELLPDREQFLYDVAWLQWTLEEMRSGEAWRHIRSML